MASPIFPIFEEKILFSKNVAPSCTRPDGSLRPCQVPEKAKGPIKLPDKMADRHYS